MGEILDRVRDESLRALRNMEHQATLYLAGLVGCPSDSIKTLDLEHHPDYVALRLEDHIFSVRQEVVDFSKGHSAAVFCGDGFVDFHNWQELGFILARCKCKRRTGRDASK